MRVAIFEVCRRPEVLKGDTEAAILSTCFPKLGIAYDLISNDGIWAGRSQWGVVNRATMRRVLSDSRISVVHFAVHGAPDGLVLRWGGPLVDREARDVLTAAQIARLRIFRDRLVVSGACSSVALAGAFLTAGASAFIAPEDEIPWGNLAAFFRAFYRSLAKGSGLEHALAGAINGRPELRSYRVVR